MDYQPPTNELIQRLEASLSPPAREIHEEMQAAIEAAANGEMPEMGIESRLAEAMARAETLPEAEREAISRIASLKARALDRRIEEDLEVAGQAELAVSVIERAQELERSAGKEPNEDMTLEEALAVLESHGENAPALNTERVAAVPQEEERRVPGFYPDFTNANEWRRWDGSEEAEMWARLMKIRERQILETMATIRGFAGPGADVEGLVRVLWNMSDEEAEELAEGHPTLV